MDPVSWELGERYDMEQIESLLYTHVKSRSGKDLHCLLYKILDLTIKTLFKNCLVFSLLCQLHLKYITKP